MTPPNTYELRMDPNNISTLIAMLKEMEARRKALASLKLVTDVEKTVLIGEAAVCQYAYLQLGGMYYANPSGAPDWSAAEASGQLPSEALAAIVDDGADHEAGNVPGCASCASKADTASRIIEPTPAPAEVAIPYRVKGGRTEIL